MDIATQTVSDTAAIHLKGADGNHLYSNGDLDKPVKIVIYGPGSKQFAAIEARQTNRAIKRMQDNDGKVSAAPPEQRVAEQAEDLADITASLENLTYSPASDKHGKELYQALYADPGLGFIPQQIVKAVKDWGNFKPG